MDENTKQKLDGYLELFNEIFVKTRDDKVSMAALTYFVNKTFVLHICKYYDHK